MPFPTPRFFRRRNTIDNAVLEDKGNNKLRKRLPFRIDRNSANLDLSKTSTGNEACRSDRSSQPLPPRRPSRPDPHNLPTLPIYQSFASKTHPPAILDNEVKPPIPEKSSSRRSSISSRIWPLPPLTRGRSVERTAPQPPRRHYSSSVDAAVPEMHGRDAPRYDRASFLAESYRSLLPGMESAGDDEWGWDPREPRSQAQAIPTRQQLEPRLWNDAAHRVHDEVRHWSTPPRPRPVSTASSSSLTAVDRDDHSPPAFDGDPFAPMYPTACDRPWSHVGDYLQNTAPTDQWSDYHQMHPQECATPYSGGRSPGRQRTSDDVGLQICTEMLNAELRKTLINRKGASKLQILLLIEAYEATLETCRKEISRPPLTRGGGGEVARKKHVREAVRILDHWLDSLYTLYDDEFGDYGPSKMDPTTMI